MEVLLARQAALQAERERLTRAIAVERRAPRADWTATFPWVGCPGRREWRMSARSTPCTGSFWRQAAPAVARPACVAQQVRSGHLVPLPALSVPSCRHDPQRPESAPPPCPASQDATVQQLLGSIFALREFRPLQREVINATLQARAMCTVAFLRVRHSRGLARCLQGRGKGK